MPIVRQADFTGGEIDPRLWGKTTHQKAPTFVRTMSNFYAVPQGAAMNRPGTKYIAPAKDQVGPPRLVSFLWPSQNYLLEVTVGWVRIYANGVVVGDVAAAALTRPMLPYLKFAQKDDSLVICYGGQGADAAIAPQVLRRISHAVWSFGALGFTPPGVVVRNIFLTDANGGLTSSPVAVPDPTHPAQPWNVAFTLTVREIATGLVSETSIVQKLTDTLVYSDAANTTALPVAYDPLFTYTAGHPVVYNGQLWTSLQAANTGHTPGDAASVTWWVNGLAIYTDAPAYYRVYNVIANAATLMPGFQVLAINVYRGKHGVWGSLGSVEVGTGEYQFADIGDTPNYAQQPPTGTDPFAIYDVSGAITGHDYPACVTHFQQRRVFARQGLHLGRIQASKPGQLNDFDVTDIVQDSDAINFDLSSQAIEDIRSLISSRALIALTSTGATVIRGAGSQRGGSTAITPASIDATKQGTRGAAWTDPVMVDNTILFAGAKGSEVRAMTYDPYWEVLGTPGADIGIVAQHFLRGHSIVDMTWQATPDSIVWLVRDDGLLLGLTFIPAQQPEDAIHGWHQHPTNGNVQRVCAVPEGTEDVLYLVVQRAGGFNLERLASRNVPNDDVRFAVFLDASLTFDGRNTGATTMAFVSDAGTYNGGEEGVITASVAAFVGDTDVGDEIVFDPDGVTGGPFSLTILSYTDATHVRAILNTPLPVGFQIATPSWAFARDTMTGLGHLEARDVMVLADGAVQGPFTVAGGVIALSQPAVYVTAGLAYTSDLELLDIIPDQVRANVKVVPKVVLEVVASRGVYTGEDSDSLKPWRTREAPDAFGNPPLVTDQIDVRISNAWNKGARVLIRQVDPLPLAVVAASRELEVGGR
jgi:hypothetical protein